jgi:hypothetical protein
LKYFCKGIKLKGRRTIQKMEILKIDLGYKQLNFGYNAKMEGYAK